MSYKTRDELLTAFEALPVSFPSDVYRFQIGTTWQGRPIYVYRIGNPSGARILFVATVHGREILGSELLYLYAKWLLDRSEEPLTSQILAQNCTYIIPCLNWDSYDIQRKNQNLTLGTGVDLNRNFQNGWCYGSADPLNWAYKGTGALSEPEAMAVYQFMNTYEVMYHYAKWLLESPESAAKRILESNLTVIVPVVNVDKYSNSRKNVNGVDLNRNFAYGWHASADPTRYDYGGPSPESEPETKALARFLERLKPAWL